MIYGVVNSRREAILPIMVGNLNGQQQAIEIIGEAVKQIPDSVRSQNPDIGCLTMEAKL